MRNRKIFSPWGIALVILAFGRMAWAGDPTPPPEPIVQEQVNSEAPASPAPETPVKVPAVTQPADQAPDGTEKNRTTTEAQEKPPTANDTSNEAEDLQAPTPVNDPEKQPAEGGEQISRPEETTTTGAEPEPSPEEPPLAEEAEPLPDMVWTLTPEFTRPLTPVQAGRNDSNPIWSPSGNLLAFERSIGDQRKIIIARQDGVIVKTIYFQTPEENGASDFFFPGITDTASYNAGMSWSRDSGSLVFMSNGGSGNYDLYLLPGLGKDQPSRLTSHPGKDSNPDWSPVADQLVYVSGRTGKADIFTLNISTRHAEQITHGQKLYLYPQWSPDGRKIAMIYGSNENHDIVVIDNPSTPLEKTIALSNWPYDDLRPVWSPDGKKIAFYSNFNLEDDQKKWCIIVVAVDETIAAANEDLSVGVVAYQVIPDIEQGPAWMPDSQHIVYVKNDQQAFNPIYLVNIVDKAPIAVKTNTRMNHDVTCAPDGTLAFRAQVEQWDHIFIAKADPTMAVLEEIK